MTAKKAAAKPEPKAEEAKSAPLLGTDGLAELQEAADQITAQGFIGTKVDPDPNHAHSVAGVTEKE
jgi:translation elongation factor EF-Ts